MYTGEYFQQWESSSSAVCATASAYRFQAKSCLICRKKSSCPISFSWLLDQSVLQRCKSSRQVVFSFFSAINWVLHIPTCLQYLNWNSICLKIFRPPWASLLMAPSIFNGAFLSWGLSPQHLPEGQAGSRGPELPWEFLWKVLYFSSCFSLQGEIEILFCRKEQSPTPEVGDMQWTSSHLEGHGEPHEHALLASPEPHTVLGPVYSQTQNFFRRWSHLLKITSIWIKAGKGAVAERDGGLHKGSRCT